jgi:hypothetical protein
MERLNVYLGDSVYATSDYGRIKLYLDNGNGPHTTIYLEQEVYDALVKFATEIGFDERPAPQQERP